MKERGERTKITADKVLLPISRIKADAMREAADKEGNIAMVNTQRRLRLASCRKAFADVD